MNAATICTRAMLLLTLLVAMLMPGAADAQSCYPAGMTGPVSITRDEFLENLRAAYALEEPRQLGGTVTIAERNDILSLNGLLTDEWPSKYITQLIFETLVTNSPIDGMPVPQLADYWEISADGHTYTFHLSERAKWHDGFDVTADDVAFSYEAAMGGLLDTRKYKNLSSKIASVRVVDENTFELKSTDPTFTFLWEVPATIPIIPKHIWAEVPLSEWRIDASSSEEELKRVIGTGPFKFKEWIRGDKVTLVRNDQHYSTVPPIDAVVLRVMGSAERPGALIARDVDIVEGIDFRTISAAVEQESVSYERVVYNRMRYLVFNTSRPPLNDVLVRQALFIALNRDAINDVASGGYGVVTVGTQPPLSLAYAPDHIEERFEYSEEEARALLAQAGWTDSNANGIVDKEGHELRIEIMSNAEMPQFTLLVEQLRTYWGRIGVQVSDSTADRWDTVQQRIREGDRDLDFDVMILNKRWDPSGNQGSLFRSNPLGGDNLMGWRNDEYDNLDEQQLHECDPGKRRDLLIRMSNLAWDEVPVGVLQFIGGSIGYNPALHNFRLNDLADTYWSLPYVWKEASES